MDLIPQYILSTKKEAELFNLFKEVSKRFEQTKAGSMERVDARLSLDNITRAIARYPG